MGADAADLRENIEGSLAGLCVPEHGSAGQRENCRVVLDGKAAVRDLDDLAHGTGTIRHQAPPDAGGVLKRQLALTLIVAAAFGADDEEPAPALPVVDLKHEPAGRVLDHRPAEDRLGLRGVLEVRCVRHSLPLKKSGVFVMVG